MTAYEVRISDWSSDGCASDLIWRYFELLSFRSQGELDEFRADVERGYNHRDIKIKLAEEIVARFHGDEAAAAAHRSAGNRMKEGELPEDLPEIELISDKDMPIASVLNKAALVKNAAVARDLLGSGGVRVGRESVVEGKGGSVGVDLGGRRI